MITYILCSVADHDLFLLFHISDKKMLPDTDCCRDAYRMLLQVTHTLKERFNIIAVRTIEVGSPET